MTGIPLVVHLGVVAQNGEALRDGLKGKEEVLVLVRDGHYLVSNQTHH